MTFFYKTSGTLGRLYKRSHVFLPDPVKQQFAVLLRTMRPYLVPDLSDRVAARRNARPDVGDLMTKMECLARRSEAGSVQEASVVIRLAELLPGVPSPVTPVASAAVPAQVTPQRPLRACATEFVPAGLEACATLGAPEVLHQLPGPECRTEAQEACTSPARSPGLDGGPHAQVLQSDAALTSVLLVSPDSHLEAQCSVDTHDVQRGDLAGLRDRDGYRALVAAAVDGLPAAVDDGTWDHIPFRGTEEWRDMVRITVLEILEPDIFDEDTFHREAASVESAIQELLGLQPPV